ncbi:hypothetical protein SRHO_G00116900 [Serrasalmus rhombeus]
MQHPCEGSKGLAQSTPIHYTYCNLDMQPTAEPGCQRVTVDQANVVRGHPGMPDRPFSVLPSQLSLSAARVGRNLTYRLGKRLTGESLVQHHSQHAHPLSTPFPVSVGCPCLSRAASPTDDDLTETKLSKYKGQGL